MNEIPIGDADSLIRALNELPNSFVYRGHADSRWRLESSLERVLGENWSAERARKLEDYSLELFNSKFHLYDKENKSPTSKLAWLSLMQHYGVPTRLIDFTESPYVALYFALEAYDPASGTDLAVFAFDYSCLMERSIQQIRASGIRFDETRQSMHSKRDQIFEDVVDQSSIDIAWVTEPQEMNVRQDRQVGSFLLSGNRSKKIEDVLASQVYDDVKLLKFVIHHELYPAIFALLRKMNITSKSLYGDLHGLARAIRMQMQVYSV